MGWVQIILLIIKYGPAVYNIVVEIIEMIKKLRNDGKKDTAAFAEQALKNAVKEYKKTGDRRRLLAIRERLRKDCYGDSCKAE